MKWVVLVSQPGDAHGDAVLDALHPFRVACVRTSANVLIDASFAWDVGSLRLGGETISTSDDTTVWWRRPGSAATAGLSEAEADLAADEVPHMLLGGLASLAPRWVDPPWMVARAEHKLLQLATATRCGIQVPRSVVTNSPVKARQAFDCGAILAKALSPGVGIAPYADVVEDADLDLLPALPCLLQQPVSAPADLRVVTVGRRSWVWRRPKESGEPIDWRAADPHGCSFELTTREAASAEALVIAEALGLSHSVQDWLDTHPPTFLEVNPVGQWLFLADAETLIVPALAEHLAHG